MEQPLNTEKIPSLEVRTDFLDFYSIQKPKLIKLIDKLHSLYVDETSKEKHLFFSLTNEHQSFVSLEIDEVIKFLENSRQITYFKAVFNVRKNNFIIKQVESDIGITYRQKSFFNFIRVSGADTKWVKAIRTEITEILEDQKNHNKFFYSSFFLMLVQISFVIIALYLSFLLAIKFKRFVVIEKAEIYLFFIIILILSNIWTYLSDSILNSLYRAKPVTELLMAEKGVKKDVIVWGIIASFLGTALWVLVTKAIDLLKF